MKIIFLDVDGVLNSNDYIKYASKNNLKGILEEINPKAIEMLKYALDITGAQIVVSSSWRNLRKFESLKKLFSEYGIDLNEKTPMVSEDRGLEIKQYLKEHPDVKQYLILDDCKFDSFDEEQISNLILTKENQSDYTYGEGLQPKHIEQIIKRFGREKKKNVEQEYER